MKIILGPFGNGKRSNPYLDLLAAAIERKSHQVSLPDRGHFPLWRAIFLQGWADVIHLQWPHGLLLVQRWHWLGFSVIRTLLFFLQIISLRILGVRFVWTVHNVINHERYHARWELFARQVLSRLVDGLIVHCDTARSIIAAKYKISPGRISVVPHGNYIGVYPPPIDRMVARRQLGLPANKTIFLYFGVIRPYKGVVDLLEAFSLTDDEGVRLILVGEPASDSLRDELTKYSKTDHRLVGIFEYVSDQKLSLLLSACDLVVLPYQNSLTSGSAVLAASFSRPVLLPSQGCLREIPSDGALFYNPDIANSLRNALDKAGSVPLQKMGNAMKIHIQPYSWDLVATETIRVYQSFLGHN